MVSIFIRSLLLVLFSLNCSGLLCQWQFDNEYNFKINIPHSWNTNSYADGTDKVYDFYGPDENSAIQLRVFHTDGNLTSEVLSQVYEENMLPQGTKKESLVAHTSKNGIPGQQGVYIVNFNGNDVAMSSFFTVQNRIGYVLTAMIPTSLLEQKSDEVKQITQSFIIDGYENHTADQTFNNKPSGIDGLVGGKSNNTVSGSGASCNGSSSMSYEGQKYKLVQIGNQCWMAENLNVGRMIPVTEKQINNDAIEKYCYDNNPHNCDKYGGLYQWDEIMQYSIQNGARGICPQGWHIPTNEEWKILEGNVDGSFGVGDPEWDKEGASRGTDVGKKLKGNSGWLYDKNGIDKYGFTALPAGQSNYDEYRKSSCRTSRLEYDSYHWTSTEHAMFGYSRMNNFSSDGLSTILTNKKMGLSVRCIKN